jgi:hypothetical protein
MTEAARLAALISGALPRVKRGSLRIWGSWFGRPFDNCHQIVACQAESDLLIVRFNEGEVLKVWAPRAATVDNESFRIGDASRVRWEWFYYGRPKTAANLCFEDFTADGAETRTATNVDWCASRLHADRSSPAVEIL